MVSHASYSSASWQDRLVRWVGRWVRYVSKGHPSPEPSEGGEGLRVAGVGACACVGRHRYPWVEFCVVLHVLAGVGEEGLDD